MRGRWQRRRSHDEMSPLSTRSDDCRESRILGRPVLPRARDGVRLAIRRDARVVRRGARCARSGPDTYGGFGGGPETLECPNVPRLVLPANASEIRTHERIPSKNLSPILPTRQHWDPSPERWPPPSFFGTESRATRSVARSASTDRPMRCRPRTDSTVSPRRSSRRRYVLASPVFLWARPRTVLS